MAKRRKVTLGPNDWPWNLTPEEIREIRSKLNFKVFDELMQSVLEDLAREEIGEGPTGRPFDPHNMTDEDWDYVAKLAKAKTDARRRGETQNDEPPSG